MVESIRRRFRISDLLILVAASAPGLVLLRIADNLNLFEVNTLQDVPWGRLFIEHLSVIGECTLGPWTLVVLALSLQRPWPSLRDVVGRPGFVACVCVTLASIPSVLYFTIGIMTSQDIEPSFTNMYANNALGRLVHGAGQLIIGAWLTLALLGRWQPGPTWMDRLGCLLGLCFVLIHLWNETYFTVVQPILALLARSNNL